MISEREEYEGVTNKMDEQATQRQTGLALDICSAESAGEGEGVRVGVR